MAVVLYDISWYNTSMLCTVCNKELERTDFYKRWHHGPYRRCKDCDRLTGRQNRKNNPETFKKKDKSYYERHKLEIIEKRKKKYQEDKPKHRAHYLVKQALYKGELLRKNCETCGDVKSLAHHDDYTKPLDVRWLCATCHMRHHHGKESSLSS